MDKKTLLEFIQAIEEDVKEVSQQIWANPEVSGLERESANLYRNKLERNGFKIVNTEGMPHAFYAEYGSGYPTIAVVAEYDALPGLSQCVDMNYNPQEEDGPGHGCGHNLLGAAAYGAALAMKKYIDDTGSPGTIRFYGCPEEETLVGKVKMIKAGAFIGCDIALTWHPMTVNAPVYSGFLSLNTMKFGFKGISAHAGQSPESGRSALDAVELMNVGSNYLREHVIQEARIHYTITNAGGAPNIIPKDAESWYYVRAPRRKDVEDITGRINNIAKGAAMMTDTSVTIKPLGGCYEMLPNQILFDLTDKNLNEVEQPNFTDQEMEFAQELQNTVDPETLLKENRKIFSNPRRKTPIFEGVLSVEDAHKLDIKGSSDSGDVSWIMPMSFFMTAAFPLGVVNHSWQATSASGSTMGAKAMLYATRVFTGMMYDLLNDHTIVEQATAEFKSRTSDHKYMSPLK